MTGGSRVVAVLVTIAVVTSVIAGGAVVGAQSDATATTDTNTSATASTSANASDTGVDLPPAEDVYVEDDGDAVLAYEGGASNDTRADYGLNVSEGLFHALVATDYNESSDVGANVTAALTRQNFTGNGTLDVPRPEALSNLSANLSGVHTSENARYDATLAATLTDENATRLPITSARTAGNLTTSGSDFEAAFEAHAEFEQEIGVSRHREYRITESEGTYTLNATEERPVSSFSTSQWATREAATATLERQYAAIARQLGGTATVTVESYEFTEGTDARPRLDIDYTVTYEGVKNAVITQVSAALATSEAVDVNESTTRNLSESLRNVSVNELYVSYDQDPRSVDAAMRADVENYGGVVLAGLDVAESINTTALGTGVVPVGGAGMAGVGAGGVAVGSDSPSLTSVENASFGAIEAENATPVAIDGEDATTAVETVAPEATPVVRDATETDGLGASAGGLETDADVPIDANASNIGMGSGAMGGDAIGSGAMGGGMMGGGVAADFNARLQQFRERFEAQRAANLTREYTFAANLSQASEGTLAVAAESHYRTDNWGAYVEELNGSSANRTDVRYDLRAATEGERVNVTAGIELSGENLLAQVTNQFRNGSATGATAGAGAMARSEEYADAFREAGFRKGRMDLTMEDGRMRLETGAAFENMTALRDAFVATGQGQRLRSMVGRTENGTTTSYVRIAGAVPENTSESEVRALAYAGDDTTVHMPGTWDRSFPAANTSQADEYLQVAGASTSDLIGPGFGLVAAVIALLAAALVAARRRG